MLLCLEFTITPSSILQHVQSIFHTQETTVDTLKNSCHVGQSINKWELTFNSDSLLPLDLD